MKRNVTQTGKFMLQKRDIIYQEMVLVFTPFATYKILDLQTPFFIESDPFFTRFRSANCMKIKK